MLVKWLRHHAAVYTARKFHLKPSIQVRTERHGSEYGGWDILANSLNADSVVYSFGVGEDASFDLSLIEQYGCRVEAFDPTPKSVDWFHSQRFTKSLTLHEYGLADHDGIVQFQPPCDPTHVSHTMLTRGDSDSGNAIAVPVKCLKTIKSRLGHDRIDLLKMDIEGAEYSVIDSLAASDIRPLQLLIEFHHRFPNVGVRESYRTHKKLVKCGYRLFSFAASSEELCYVHRQHLAETPALNCN